jgi:hypothetical protein
MVDECWVVDPTTVDDGIEPTNGRLRLPTSTAHRRRKPTFPRRRAQTLAEMSAPAETRLIE